MPTITIARFEEEVLLVHQSKEHAPSTLRQVKQVLSELRAAGAARTSDFTSALIARWKLKHPARTPVTWRSHLRCFRALCVRAAKKGYVRENPFEVDPVGDWVRDDSKSARPRQRWSLKREEIRRVLDLADREAEGGDWQALRRRAYVWTLLTLGMRAGELQRLETWDVNLKQRTVTIRAKDVPVQGKASRWWRPKTTGSGGHDPHRGAVLPIGDKLAAVLADWIPRTGCRWLFPGVKRRGPWTCGGPGVRPLDQMKALGDRAGVRLWNKSGRKSLGTHARGAGLTTLERQGLFRHAEEETGEFYDEDEAEGLRSAVDKIERYYLAGF